MSNSGKSSVSAAEREKFEQYLLEMDDVLEEFVAYARDSGVGLDYSLDSLAKLEGMIASHDRNDEKFLNRTARYLGEVFRKVVGGKWQLCLKEPNYLYYKLPVIAGYADVAIEFCPRMIVQNYNTRRKSGLLKIAVESHMEYCERDNA